MWRSSLALIGLLSLSLVPSTGCEVSARRGGGGMSEGVGVYHDGQLVDVSDYETVEHDTIEYETVESETVESETTESEDVAPPPKPYCVDGDPKYNGYVSIQRDDELERWAACEEITGDLDVTYYKGKSNVSFPNLKKVGVTLRVRNNAQMTSISFPALSEVGHGIVIDVNPKLTSIGFPSLTCIGDRLRIVDNQSLSDCLAQALATQLGQCMKEAIIDNQPCE